jgi:TolA-binding protein
MRQRSLLLTLVIGVATASSSGITCAAFAAAPQVSHSLDLTSQVAKMEQGVFGSVSKNKPLAVRIKNLEMHALCQTGRGTLKQRIDKLESVIGLSTDTSPPFAPERNGTEKKSAGNRKTPAHLGTAPSTAPSFNPADKPGEVRRLLLEAIKLHQDGKLPEAEQRFREVVKLDPYNGDACFSLGSLAEARSDLAAALGYYSAASVADPNDKESRDAVLQVQEKISQQQGPFVNPLSVVSRNGQAPVLQARASEFTAADMPSAGILYPQTPMAAQPIVQQPYFPTGAVRQQNPIPVLNVGQNPPPVRQSSGTGRAVARGLARMAVGAALNASGLHCPLCNILRGF